MSACILLRERNFLVTAALVHPLDFPWHRLYASGDRGSFIATVSLPPEAFQVLLAVFSRHYIVRSGPGRPGRPTKFVFKHSVLACLLYFYTAAVENKTLSEIFGVPPSTLSRTLVKAKLALDGALAELQNAQIRNPSKRKQRMWAMAAEEREPLVNDVCVGGLWMARCRNMEHLAMGQWRSPRILNFITSRSKFVVSRS